jgi:gamma-glutamylcyclotransferase (GGCT)/AIG2-like uncharacterized protein YtfP
MIRKNIAADINSVFVYGTLMPGGQYEHIAKQAGKYQAEKAYIEGMLLFDLEPEGYPGLVHKDSNSPLESNSLFDSNSLLAENPTGRVEGYVLHFEDITVALTLLDELEDCHLEPPLYQREKVTVQPSGNVAWVYIYAHNERLEGIGATLISSGQWRSGRWQGGISSF